MSQIHVSTPTRIDLAGGTIDLWPIHQMLKKKATVNLGINLNAEVRVERVDHHSEIEIHNIDQNISVCIDFDQLPENNESPLVALAVHSLWTKELGGLKITTKANSPAGAGLGGSSALLVAVLRGLEICRRLCSGKEGWNDKSSLTLVDERGLVARAADIEAKLIASPTGCQDYWGAVRGGLNVLEYPPGLVQVQTLRDNVLEQLNNQLVVCYSGQSRQSAINNWEIFSRVFSGDKQILAKLEEIGELASLCGEAALKSNITKMLDYSLLEWQKRCELWPNITTSKTQELDAAGKNAGALFSRVCGAGGGGVMAFFCNPENKQKLSEKLRQAGGVVLDAKISEKGLEANVVRK